MEKIKVCEALSGLPIYALHIFHKKNPRQDRSQILAHCRPVAEIQTKPIKA